MLSIGAPAVFLTAYEVLEDWSSYYDEGNY